MESPRKVGKEQGALSLRRARETRETVTLNSSAKALWVFIGILWPLGRNQKVTMSSLVIFITLPSSHSHQLPYGGL